MGLSLKKLAEIAVGMDSSAKSAEFAATWTDNPRSKAEYERKAKQRRRLARLTREGIERKLTGR